MISSSSLRAILARAVVLAAVCSAWFGSAAAQNVRVVSANSSNNSIYDVDFDTRTVLQINDDQSTRTSIRSMVFFALSTSTEPAVDLIVADTPRDEILLYSDPTFAAPASGVTIWDPTLPIRDPGLAYAGPLQPDGLSMDAAQNLFVLSSDNGASLDATVWVLPRADASATEPFLPPVLLDSGLSGYRVLAESTVSRVTIGPAADPLIGIGDLLVVTTGPSSVLLYHRADIAAVLDGTASSAAADVLLGPAAFPDGDPAGIAFWPTDDSVLITTSTGTIQWFEFDGVGALVAKAAPFASGLGNGQFKAKTGYRDGQPRAFVANRNGGQLFEFEAPSITGLNAPLAIVTTGVESPNGLAVTNVASADAYGCVVQGGVPTPNGGCDALGGVLTHQLVGIRNSTVTGSVLQTPCIVPVDPRLTNGVCSGAPLPLSSVCPEFAPPAGYDDVIIPGELCGDPSFAVVQTLAPGIAQTDGYLFTIGNPDEIFPVAPEECPFTAIAWSPIPGGSETPSLTAPGEFEELTGACGTSRLLSRTSSYFALIGLDMTVADPSAPSGLGWDETQLTAFILEKYDHVDTVLSVPGIVTDQRRLRELQRCITQSRRDFERGRRIDLAATELIQCNVLLDSMGADGIFRPVPQNPNTYGEVRGRLANLYLTIWTRLLGNPPNATWPPTN